MYFWFIIISLTVWRLTHLFSKEDGPFDIIFLLRKKAGSGFFGKLFDCFYCMSIWIALPFGLWQGNFWWQKLLYWVSFSGAACLLEQATTHRDNDHNTPQFKED
jgi:hypothetical protein